MPGFRAGENTDYSVFVGDLAPDVTDFILEDAFRRYFSSVRCAKVKTGENTTRP
jgi:hypothetical protein